MDDLVAQCGEPTILENWESAYSRSLLEPDFQDRLLTIVSIDDCDCEDIELCDHERQAGAPGYHYVNRLAYFLFPGKLPSVENVIDIWYPEETREVNHE
jgi:hypothetical protein